MTAILIATLTMKLIGFSEVSPGICQADYLVDRESVSSKIVSCESVRDPLPL